LLPGTKAAHGHGDNDDGRTALANYVIWVKAIGLLLTTVLSVTTMSDGSFRVEDVHVHLNVRRFTCAAGAHVPEPTRHAACRI